LPRIAGPSSARCIVALYLGLQSNPVLVLQTYYTWVLRVLCTVHCELHQCPSTEPHKSSVTPMRCDRFSNSAVCRSKTYIVSQ
jgi:hypothetical protein